MIANYHTHTWRCSHAVGTEEEYVQAAIQRGLQILGFSDHSPYCFPDGYYSGFRVKLDQVADYAGTIHALRDRYAPQISLHLGVEIEYYPAWFGDTLSMLRDHQFEYMILGQHFLNNEIGEAYSGTPTEDETKLSTYCRQVMEAINTGLFTYIAHPDLLHFTGDPAVYTRHMRTLCREARDCGVPLEINLLGVEENRHYPNRLFWETAAEEGCPVVLGCDAHRAGALLDEKPEKRALELAAQLGLTVLEKPVLRQI